MRKMKDSGEQWIGDIPTVWGLSRIVSLYRLRNTKVSDKDYMPLSVTMNGIVPQLETAAKTNAHDDRKLVKKGDFAINSRSDRRGSCGISDFDGSVSLINTILAPLEKMNPRYYNWLFHTVQFADEFYKWGHGIVDDLWTTGWQDMKRIMIPVPSLQEQESIAAFLDSKCAEIDALTADIQAQIDTLEQYKRSVITEAVTKGLNPDVEMKGSGIEWVGMIPASWHVHPVYYYFGERKNKNYALQEQNLLSLSYGRIIRKDINTNGGLLPASFNTYNIVEPGDIIIRPTDLQNDKRSLRTGFVIERGIITSAYIDLMPKENVNSKYFHYLLHSFDVQKVFYNMGNGVRQGLNYSEFAKLMIFEPSLQEQNVIVDFLDKKCAEIDAIIVTKQEQMTTLVDYKKSLIYEYVTGKKEVPQAVSDQAPVLDPQVILLGILINKLGRDIRGKIQLQKMLYLTNEYVGLNRGVQYYRYAHGPYDLQLEQYVEVLVSNHWYEEKHQGADLLLAGKNHADFVEKYGDRFNDKQAEIDKLIDFLGPMKTSQVERIATLFAAWNDFIIDGNPAPTDSQIIHEVMNNWTDNKAHTQYATWQGTLKKMKKHGIVPKGLGLHTLPKA